MKKEKIKKKSLFFYIFGFLSILILIIEFSFDLKKDILLSKLVFFLNFTLLIFYYLLIIYKIYLNKHRLIYYFRDEKADVAFNILILTFLFMPRLAAGLVIMRLSISLFLKLLKTNLGKRFIAQLNLRPSQTMALSFIGVILFGSLLLTIPAATKDGLGATFINALFTITSAACVTGLSVYDIGEFFTLFGQAVILCSIQVGGLGIMVLSAAFAVMLGGRIHSRRQVGLREVLDISTPEGLRSLIKAVSAATIVMEFLGAFCLFICWSKDIPNFYERIWWAIFHAVSAFCNAGFGLAANSLVNYVNNPWVCSIIMILITVGGLGFFVISDLTSIDVWQIKKVRAIWARLEIQTRVVILATIFLDVMGMLLFLFFEYDGALAGLRVESKILASFFQSVTLRTAGFFSVSQANLTSPTVLFCVALMFIGAAPGSTGGGIKTTTAFVSLMTIRAMLRGREHVEMFGRTIPPVIVNRSLSIVLIAATLVVVFLICLLATQNLPFLHLLFEAVSAFATVGLSMDITPLLNDTGKLLIIALMYIGRIGPLTLALAIGEKKVAQGYWLPMGRIAVG